MKLSEFDAEILQIYSDALTIYLDDKEPDYYSGYVVTRKDYKPGIIINYYKIVAGKAILIARKKYGVLSVEKDTEWEKYKAIDNHFLKIRRN